MKQTVTGFIVAKGDSMREIMYTCVIPPFETCSIITNGNSWSVVDRSGCDVTQGFIGAMNTFGYDGFRTIGSGCVVVRDGMLIHENKIKTIIRSPLHTNLDLYSGMCEHTPLDAVEITRVELFAKYIIFRHPQLVEELQTKPIDTLRFILQLENFK